jgi:hypothetical protein
MWSNREMSLYFHSTTPPSCDGSGLVSSPDLHDASGTLAVMATGANAPRESYRLHLIDVADLSVETVGPELATPVSLRWDSTGTRVVVGGRDGAWVIARDGKAERVRTGHFCGADWSPDDRYIVTSCGTTAGKLEIELFVLAAPH